MEIVTERLILRDFVPGDFEAFFATTNDPEHQTFYSDREMTRTFWEELFERILAGTVAPDRTAYQLAICLKTGELIGTCGVRIEEAEHRQASYGGGIARAYWGGGYAYEASQQIIDFGFSSLPIHRVYAETISENRRSRVLAERLGMRLEGELKQHRFLKGRWWDTVIYAILQDEWNKPH
jgi:RimJ/RimL family protein N-acetyltransferase